MKRIQVVVATMNQRDFSLVKKMNINTDVVIANQSDYYSLIKEKMENINVTMVTTNTKGVGINRNYGLLYADPRNDIILFSDDDIVYNNEYKRIVLHAFNELQEADVIIFQMRFLKSGKVYDIDRHKTKRLHLYNGLSFGTYQIAIRHDSLIKANIKFTHLFGGGSVYSCGEDSLFLIDCFRKGLKVYSYEGLIGDNIRDSSTWFEGFNKKFFFDRGAFVACAFPYFSLVIMLYYLYAYRKVDNLSSYQKIKLMISGYRAFNSVLSYEQWEKKNNE